MSDEPKRMLPRMPTHRDALVRKDTPLRGVDIPVFVDPDNDKTDVHNAAIRALAEIRELDKKIDASKTEAARAHGALKAEVLGLKTTVDKMDQKLDRIAEGHAAVAAIVQDRGRRSSGPQRQVEDTVKTVLADRVLAEDSARRDFRRKVALAIVSGFASGAVILWLLQHYLGGR